MSVLIGYLMISGVASGTLLAFFGPQFVGNWRTGLWNGFGAALGHPRGHFWNASAAIWEVLHRYSVAVPAGTPLVFLGDSIGIP